MNKEIEEAKTQTRDKLIKLSFEDLREMKELFESKARLEPEKKEHYQKCVKQILLILELKAAVIQTRIEFLVN